MGEEVTESLAAGFSKSESILNYGCVLRQLRTFSIGIRG